MTPMPSRQDRAGLAALTQAIADSAGAPGVLVYIDPELADDLRPDRDWCQPVPTLAINAELAATGTTQTVVAAAAHSIAHLTLGHAEAAWKLWVDRILFGLAGTAMLAALYPAAPARGTVLLLTLAAMVLVFLARAALHRREEYAADARAVDLLNDAGLAGTTSMRRLLAEQAGYESGLAAALGVWIASTRPPAHRRLAALTISTGHPA